MITMIIDGEVHSIEPGPLMPIIMGLAQIKHYKKHGTSVRTPEQVDWEIRLYEWILSQPDKEEKARLYCEARKIVTSKEDVCKRLGWDIK